MLLYIHVPFCGRRCSYCDFAIAVRREAPSELFAELVLAEWARRREDWSGQAPLETVYFGGGTPSRLAPDALRRILARLRTDGWLGSDAEVTLEANPEDVTENTAGRWRDLGITRVSLGVQSFDPGVLAWMHRTHGPDAAPRAVDALRRAGLANLSLDLIYGLPDHLERDWPADLARALELRPEHLSLYGLTVEANTPLGRWVDRGAAVPADDLRAAGEYLLAAAELARRGYRHYEVSNAGLPGFESRHNLGYWDRKSYLGLGPSAHSARADRRWWNQREWEAYRAAIASGGIAVSGEEILTGDQIEIEETYLGLRTDAGVPASSLPAALVDQWLAADWASRAGSRVRLTAEGWLRLDALVSRVLCS